MRKRGKKGTAEVHSVEEKREKGQRRKRAARTPGAVKYRPFGRVSRDLHLQRGLGRGGGRKSRRSRHEADAPFLRYGYLMAPMMFGDIRRVIGCLGFRGGELPPRHKLGDENQAGFRHNPRGILPRNWRKLGGPSRYGR